MTQPKFKIGDRVEITSNRNPGYQLGMQGKIVAQYVGRWWTIDFGAGFNGHSGKGHDDGKGTCLFVNEDDFKLIEPTPNPLDELMEELGITVQKSDKSVILPRISEIYKGSPHNRMYQYGSQINYPAICDIEHLDTFITALLVFRRQLNENKDN